ncbi:D-alanyl-lipoteichoic acid biosynthesis protein DltD [uncultured Clostridium sp.]|uniref:D-alanyl-lipoteichoic acid biosynthesis protein DltD n=1 Tax=uncultured Clostridium sp. TaxID=59620 RepID=UPI0025F06042|nr:D-alanyl-lipoteichoic acid biosynthesis protein DltD [uncultured Clostridium sp.]
MRKIGYILLPIIIGIITFTCLSNFLDSRIYRLLEVKDLNEINNEYGGIYKNKGVVYNNYVINEGNIIIQATSELNVPVSQKPTNFFPIEGMDDVTTLGIQGSQDLTQLSILASQQNILNKQVATIISIQWFYNKDGVKSETFQSNFAPVQFYSVLNNNKIEEKNKEKYSHRVDELLTGSNQYLPEKIYAKVYYKKDILSQTIKVILKPYFCMRANMVKLKDKGLLYKKLISLPNKQKKTIKNINWQNEYSKAEEQGKKMITNNDYMVYDKYYNKNKDTLKTKKNSLNKVNLMDSKEMDDYKLYLDICDNLDIKPYVILMPTNGKWYDCLGLGKEKRQEFYDEVQKIAEERGFKVLNLKEHEYELYYMCDASHFGWKGWLEIDEAIYNNFKKQ